MSIHENIIDGCPKPTQAERPFILGIGGTTAADSSSEKALKVALKRARALGARTEIFGSSALDMPNYRPGMPISTNAARLIDAVIRCDGIIISTPAYHGGMSGMIKNALDYIEELRADTNPYLSGRVVGTIVCAYGDQAMGTTLSSVRSVIHALRGWPTPLGVSINSAQVKFASDGTCSDAACVDRLQALAEQVVSPISQRCK